jgi:uncharacterized protein (DUF433 family)
MYEDVYISGTMSTPTHGRSEAAIVTSEGVLGGKPRIAGHRISVLDVVELLDVGYSIEETAEQLQITTQEVREAAGYYRHHRSEIEALAERRQAKNDELRDS